jgi:hypothetical protein
VHNTKHITFKAVQKIVNRFIGKSAKTDRFIKDLEILRMAQTASMIPISNGPEARLVDIGGTVFLVTNLYKASGL